MQEEEFLGWLIHQKKHTEIPEVTDEMKDKLIETFPHVAVIFCKCRKTFKSRIVAKIQCNGEWKAFYQELPRAEFFYSTCLEIILRKTKKTQY